MHEGFAAEAAGVAAGQAEFDAAEGLRAGRGGAGGDGEDGQGIRFFMRVGSSASMRGFLEAVDWNFKVGLFLKTGA